MASAKAKEVVPLTTRVRPLVSVVMSVSRSSVRLPLLVRKRPQ